MKPYTVRVDIDLPRDRVIELFDDVDNLYKWQKGLQSFKHKSGDPGQPGAVSEMVFLNGKHRIQMTETITDRRLPDEFNGIYQWKGGSNTLRNRFIELGPEKTRWESTSEYTSYGFTLKAMGFLAPGVFKKQNQMFLDNFKAFCEHGTDVRQS